MNLPKPNYTTPLRQSYQAQFGGLNHTKGASDGDIYDMRNMTSDHYPVLSPREKRKLIATADNIRGVYCHGDQLVYVAGNDLYVDGESYPLGEAEGDVFFAALGERIIVMPHKKLFDVATKEMKQMEASVSKSNAVFPLYGTLYNQTAEFNSIQMSNVDFADYFSVGDAVTIEGCTKRPENNLTAIIREIDGDVLSFYANTFTLDALYYGHETTTKLISWELATKVYYYFQIDKQWYRFSLYDMESWDAMFDHQEDIYIDKNEKLSFSIGENGELSLGWVDSFEGGGGAYGIPVEKSEAPNKDPAVDSMTVNGTILTFFKRSKDTTEPGTITISRVIPDFDYILAVNNRLWGAKGDTVWGSKLGDPTNWNYFDGLSVDSYSVNLGSAGDITGIANYNGYPTFFKENGIYKLYGAYPSAFQIYSTATTGVKAGCGKSIAKIGEALYYVSKNGVMMYAGGVPRYIGNELGVRIGNAVGGTDGRKYYLCADGLLYVYDTYMGLWHIEDKVNATAMSYGDDLVCVTADGYIMTLGHSLKADEADVSWMVQFADAVVGSPNKKGVEKVLLRAVCEEDAYCDVYISFDHGEYEHIRKITQHTKATDILPIVLKRGDNFSLKLIGKGVVDIYSLSYHYYNGSER